MHRVRYLFCIVIALASGMAVRADGSKDMYPRAVRGNRAFLVAGQMNGHPQLFNQAAHYAYARVGEVIAVASSAQGIGNGHIMLTAPDNVTQYVTEIGSAVGSIRAKSGYGTREAELAGPRVGYDAFERTVQPGQEGIWKVEFFPSGGDGGINQPPDVRADDNWNQLANRNHIAAWDVSVRDAADTHWVQGRVFFHVLNLFLNFNTMDSPAGAFYGRNYVLTRDGYIYRVDGNGSHGINFFYFVNNSGFLDQAGNPSYKSTSENSANYHNPNAADNARHVTHKMMYSMPDVHMPAASAGAIPGGQTWLYQQTQIAKIEHIAISFIEGSKNHVNPKGAFVTFETNYAGRYKITLAPAAGVPEFPKREIFHDATVGANRVHWDGLDGQQRFVPGGEYPVAVSVAMVEGEIHFPYLDMEINPQGIIVDRINPDGSYNGPAMVYWDDTAIVADGQPLSERSNPTVNMDGISSHANGHKWGTYRDQDRGYGRNPANGNYGQYSFGNQQAMDTWSYTEQVDEEITETIAVMEADLEVVSVTADRDTITPEEIVRYSIALRNNGPVDAEHARFEYSLPYGFFVLGVSVDNDAGCGSLLSSQQNGSTFQAVLNLSASAGCQTVIHVQAATGPTVPDATYGNVEATAGIVRPPGYWDPDATSTDVDATKPGTAAAECNGYCNNIKTNVDVLLLEPVHERGALALLKTVRHIDADNSGFQEEGELLEYTFTVRNTGLVPVSDIFLADKLLSDQLIAVGGVLQPNAETILTRQYRITVADVARKYVENTAVVVGKNPRGFAVRDVSGTTFDNDRPTRIAIDTKPELRLLKKVANGSRGTGQDGQFTIGDNIVYRFEVRHQGAVGVEHVQIWDANISAQSYSVNPTVLFNQTASYELTYTVTAADIRAGRVENTAVVSGMDQKYGRILEDVSGQTFADDLPTVTELAKPPQGIGDLFEVYQGNATWLDVLANDEKGSSDIVHNSIEIIVPPTLGTLAVDGDKLLYTPLAGTAPIEDKFVYRFADRSRLTGQAEGLIVVVPTVPIAVDDRFAVRYNQPITFDPSENDYADHSEIVPESIRVTVPPKHGTFFLMGDGRVMYTPDDHYTGYDELKYSIRDRNGNWSEEATVLLEVFAFFLPNVITPNGDGRNDTFEVLGSYRFDRVELEIIDRFGGRVFRSSDYKNDWQIPDNVSDGTYFYIFKGIKGREKPVLRRGSVLVVRKVAR